MNSNNPVTHNHFTVTAHGKIGSIKQIDGNLEVEVIVRRKGEAETTRITFDASKVQYDPTAFIMRALPTSIINVDTCLGLAVIKTDETKGTIKVEGISDT